MPRRYFEPGAPRVAIFTIAQAVVGFALLIEFVDLESAEFSIWKVALFAALTYAGAFVRDLSEYRRVSTNMEGLLFVPGLFLLGPVELIVGRLIGGHLATQRSLAVSHKVRFNTSAQFMVIAAIAAAMDTIDPHRSVATASVEEAGVAGLVAVGVYSAFIPVWSIAFRVGQLGYRHVNRQFVVDTWSSYSAVIVEFSLGTLIVMVMATSLWMFVPILVLLGLVLQMNDRAAKNWILTAGMDHILALTRSASENADPDETFSSVAASVQKLGGVDEAIIAHIDENDEVWFEPQPGPLVARELDSAEVLRSRADSGVVSVSANGRRAGSLGVWRLSETTGDFLITFCNRPASRLRSFGQAVDIMSQHAAVVHTTTSQRSELERRGVEAHKKARTDETTGRPNRLAAVEWLESALTGQERLAIIGVRIHGLDALEQVLGEQAADADLRDFVDEILDTEDFEFVARVRDEVFVLMKPGGIEEAIQAAECIVSSDDHQSDSLRAVAAGVVEVPPNSSADPQSLLADCWVALARAERDGVKIANFDEMDAESARRRFAIAQALPEAIDQGHIYPVFQPQIDIRRGKLLGCEVLARWIHPELGFVSPVEFIEIAEQGNLIEPLTKLMLTSTCAARSRWTDLGINVQFSVNVSARSLLQHSFIKQMAELFMEVDLREDELTIEITESTIADDDATTATALELLHTFGATISIDDFGTGYSALAYLHRLPVDEVKIDKSMVMALGQDRDPTNVVAGLIKICHSLGIRVVAEGVENDEALRRLEALDCDIAQGYLFAKPMKEQDWCAWALAWLRR